VKTAASKSQREHYSRCRVCLRTRSRQPGSELSQPDFLCVVGTLVMEFTHHQHFFGGRLTWVAAEKTRRAGRFGR